MGWGGGTKVFDQVADDLINVIGKHTGDGFNSQLVIVPLTNLYKTLSALDWDNEDESDYWDHPVIGRILGNTFEYDEQE